MAMREDLSPFTHKSNTSEPSIGTMEIDTDVINQANINDSSDYSEQDESERKEDELSEVNGDYTDEFIDQVIDEIDVTNIDDGITHNEPRNETEVEPKSLNNEIGIDTDLEHQTNESDSSDNHFCFTAQAVEIWDVYIKHYGYPPQSVSHLISFSKYSPDMTMLRYVDAREMFI
eukprot:397416_1